MSDFAPNDGSLDPEEIWTFDPTSLSEAQRRELRRFEREREEELWREHKQGIRDSFENPPENEAEFNEKFIDPRD